MIYKLYLSLTGRILSSQPQEPLSLLQHSSQSNSPARPYTYLIKAEKYVNNNSIIATKVNFPPKRELYFSPVFLDLLYKSKRCIITKRIIIDATILLFKTYLQKQTELLYIYLLSYYYVTK